MADKELNFNEKVALFRATATDMQARADYAASRAEVINPLLTEQSTIRAIFQTEKLAPGADARYDIPFEDIEACWVMPGIGGIPAVQVEGAELHVDTFGLDGGIEYQIDIAKDGRFDVASRSTNLLKQKFIRQEELAGWSLIHTHAGVLPANQVLQAFADDGLTQVAGQGYLNIYTLNELLTAADLLGVGGRKIGHIYVSPRRYGDLRRAVTMEALPFTMREKLYGGGYDPNSPVPEIQIHKVWNSSLVADNMGYAFTEKEGYRYGVMPIREELNTRDNPVSILEWKIGIIGRERVGFGVLDDKGLIQITF